MTQSTLQSRQSERGFTLVELAIVMIIIGLLIGGILKGQELINNARVSSTAAQAKAIESGISTFRDKYAAYPGDMGPANPNTRIPNCAGMCNDPGNGDSRAQTGTANDPGAASVLTDEAAVAMVQLGAAGMLGGINGGAAALGNGVSHPTTPLGGVWNYGYSDGVVDATAKTAAVDIDSGHYIATANVAGAAAAAGTVPLQPAQASAIDTKLDDGRPNTGTVRGIGGVGAAACADAGTAAGIYNDAISAVVCGIYVKVSN